MRTLLCTRRFTLQLVTWAVLSAATLGLAADCEQTTGGSGSGMYQGPGDGSPRYRR
jgi:hypothetical protein